MMHFIPLPECECHDPPKLRYQPPACSEHVEQATFENEPGSESEWKRLEEKEVGPYSTPSASSMVSNSSTAASGSWSSAFLGTPGYIPLMASVTSLTLYPILMASVAVQLTLQHSLCRSDRCPPPTGQSRHIPNCVHPTPPGQLAAAETPRGVHVTTRVCLFVWGELPKVGSKPSEVQGVDSPRLKHIVEFCLELRCTFHSLGFRV